MKKFLITIIIVLTSQQFKANLKNELLVENLFKSSFLKAYSLNPSIPKGVLESIAFSQSRFAHLGTTSQEPSCIGYPTAYGVMGLTENGQGYFRNNLITVSSLSGYSIDDIKINPEKNILAYAKAFSVLQTQNNIFGNNIMDYKPIFLALSELPLVNDLQNDYALNTQMYQYYWFLSNNDFQNYYNFPNYSINLQNVFGSNYQVLSSGHVIINSTSISNNTGVNYRSSGFANSVAAAPDYAPAIWNPTTCNFSSRGGTAISMVAIHDVEGSYAGCISWFKNCSSSASAHYVIRSSDGQITQMVLESDKAWHIASENPYTLGIEHEGYNNVATWYTTAMLQASADLVRDMCAGYSINPLRCYFGPGCSGTTQQCLQGTCVKIKGHQMFPNQSHNDPGPFWNWEKYYKMINNTIVTTTITATSGTFYDTGGASANYNDDDRKFWLFKPSGGATSISMNFTSFSLENRFDYLYIYDGSTTNATLIGKYTNTVSPGNINSTGPNLLFEFRSDCATNQAGWVASYTTNAVVTPTVVTDAIAPTTAISTTGAWKTANFNSTFTDGDAGGSNLQTSFYQVLDFDGTEWRGNNTRGFFSDNFDNTIHPEWTLGSGTWGINNNALVQSLQTPSTTAYNTNIYASLTQTLSNKYLYNFKGKIDGSGPNRRAGFHFFVDNPTLPNRGNSYFVYFRLDIPKIQIYKTVNDAIYLKADSMTNVSLNAGQWYDFKVIFDRTNGKISVYKDNTLAATWTDNTPLATGDVAPLANGNYISFRSGECTWSLDEIKVYRSRLSNSTIPVTVGSANTNDVRFQNSNPLQYAGKIKSIVNDGAGNLSTIDYEDLNIDWTNPTTIGTINDGKAADINNIVTSDSLSANWSTSDDLNSGIARYWYSIGTSPGAVNTLGWTSNWGSTLATAKNLTLTTGSVYYFNVKSENGAGLESPIISSNGQTVTTNTTSTGINTITESNLISVFPNPFSNNFTISIDLLYNTNVELSVFDEIGKQIAYFQTKESAGKYFKVIDTAGLNLSVGTYLIQVKLNEKTLFKKMIKQ